MGVGPEAHVNLTGYDAAGNPLSVAVPPNADPVAVQQNILQSGGRVLSARWFRGDRPGPEGITAEQFARFNEMLATAVRRQVPLLEGIRELSREFRTARFSASLDQVSERLQRGASLREAFEPQRTRFPKLYGALLEAGMAAGNLPQVLLRLSRNIRVDAAFRRAIMQALIYPTLLVTVGVGMLLMFMAIILPRYTLVAGMISVKMPWLLGGTFGAGQPGARLMALLFVIVVLTGLLWAAVGRHGVGRPVTEYTARHAPFFRAFYEAATWSAYADTLALLLRAQAPMPTALRLAGPATGADWLARTSERLAAEIEAGRKLSDAAREDRDIPRRVLHAFEHGEAQRDPTTALEQLAERYRRESERRALNIIRYLPPTLSVVFGLAVLGVALIVLGPFFSFWGGAW